MALTIESGDVFNALYEANEAGKNVLFVHGCNAQGKMGSGVASLVKKLYYFAYDAYMNEHRDFGLVLGDVVFASNLGVSKVTVANAITQKNYGRDGKLYVDYDAVVDSMQVVRRHAKQYNLPVYLPMIGGGLGGGDTKRLTAIFQAVFHDVDATLYLKED
jgi:O-acetyl-ADP-ribose deacetylase (regulator of RNase III)